jgi:hypothetical protein
MRRALVIATTALSLLLLPATAHAATNTPTAPSPAGLTQLKAPGAVKAGSAAAAGIAPQASQPPVFANYLVCFNGWVYTDFTDPDGDDTKLNVLMAVYRPNYGGWNYFWMTNTGPSAHGVFFYQQLSAIGVDPATVTFYAFAGYDQTATWSPWTYADSNCRVL